MGSRDNYYAYLLRIWREDQQSPWRASLQEAHAGQLLNFASLAQLIVFLEQRTAPNESEVGPISAKLEESDHEL
jgi:hypothetical protein